MLLSFYNEDIPNILARHEQKQPAHKMRHMYSNVGDYLHEVCREIATLYPSSVHDVGQLTHYFKISMQQQCDGTRHCDGAGTLTQNASGA